MQERAGTTALGVKLCMTERILVAESSSGSNRACRAGCSASVVGALSWQPFDFALPIDNVDSTLHRLRVCYAALVVLIALPVEHAAVKL